MILYLPVRSPCRVVDRTVFISIQNISSRTLVLSSAGKGTAMDQAKIAHIPRVATIGTTEQALRAFFLENKSPYPSSIIVDFSNCRYVEVATLMFIVALLASRLSVNCGAFSSDSDCGIFKLCLQTSERRKVLNPRTHSNAV